MRRSFGVWAVLTVLTFCDTALVRAAQTNCGGVGLASKVISLSTGSPELRSQFGKSQARVWAMIQFGGPEFKSSYVRITNDLLAALQAGAADADHTVLAFNRLLENLNVTDQQRAIALVAADFFRDSQGNAFPGLILAFNTPDSSSWIVTAAAGNRGFFSEIVGARNAVLSGIRFTDGSQALLVQKERIIGLGKRLTTSAGGTVEGDLVEAIAAGERWIDLKGIDAGFDLAQLNRVGDAMAEGGMAEFVFAVEEGARIPSDWLTRLSEINAELLANNRQPIRWGIVSGF